MRREESQFPQEASFSGLPTCSSDFLIPLVWICFTAMLSFVSSNKARYTVPWAPRPSSSHLLQGLSCSPFPKRPVLLPPLPPQAVPGVDAA